MTAHWNAELDVLPQDWVEGCSEGPASPGSIFGYDSAILAAWQFTAEESEELSIVLQNISWPGPVELPSPISPMHTPPPPPSPVSVRDVDEIPILMTAPARFSSALLAESLNSDVPGLAENRWWDGSRHPSPRWPNWLEPTESEFESCQTPSLVQSDAESATAYADALSRVSSAARRWRNLQGGADEPLDEGGRSGGSGSGGVAAELAFQLIVVLEQRLDAMEMENRELRRQLERLQHGVVRGRGRPAAHTSPTSASV